MVFGEFASYTAGWGMVMCCKGVDGSRSGGRALCIMARTRAVLAGGVAAAILIAAAGSAQADLSGRYPVAKRVQPAKKAPKPLQVPLIAISIATQRLTLYDRGVPIAQAPVSTGMPGHATPTGIFSVIQKQIYHRSNIYSGAPMPYMQRITWSGVAIHAGVLPGYPASHGCIRMPYDFAVRLYGLTRAGARVIITRNEIAPVAFEHPGLFQLPKPAPDKVGQLIEPVAPAPEVKPAAGVKTAQRRTAMMMSDVGEATTAQAPAGIGLPRQAEPGELATAPENPAATAEAPQALPADAAQDGARDDAQPGVLPAAQTGAQDRAQRGGQAGTEIAAPSFEPATGTVMVKPVVVTPAQPVEVPNTFEPTRTPATVETAAGPKVETSLIPFGPELPLRPGPITVFVSKKEGKVFVRKGFQPVLSAPVTIARPDLPLGTHVFTASEPMPDGVSFRWLELSLLDPSTNKVETLHDPRRHKSGHTEKTFPTSATAAEALDRVEIPAAALARISALMSQGATLIISDQGLGPETGTETDFIVLTR